MQNSADLSTDVPRVFWEKVGWGGAREAIRPKFCMHNSVEISLKLCMQNCVEILAKTMYANSAKKIGRIVHTALCGDFNRNSACIVLQINDFCRNSADRIMWIFGP